MTRTSPVALLLLLVLTHVAIAQQPRRTVPSPAQGVRNNLKGLDAKLLEMAKDWPADKYDFRLKPEMRSFGEVLVHVVAGNMFAAKVGRGDASAKWNELDGSKYKTKAEVVALLEKNFGDSEAAAAAVPDEAFTKSLFPWVSVIEHSAEHYGLLVAYYRASGMVPPETRKNPQGN
jgi:hypothetical protein